MIDVNKHIAVYEVMCNGTALDILRGISHQGLAKCGVRIFGILPRGLISLHNRTIIYCYFFHYVVTLYSINPIILVCFRIAQLPFYHMVMDKA